MPYTRTHRQFCDSKAHWFVWITFMKHLLWICSPDTQISASAIHGLTLPPAPAPGPWGLFPGRDQMRREKERGIWGVGLREGDPACWKTHVLTASLASQQALPLSDHSFTISVRGGKWPTFVIFQLFLFFQYWKLCSKEILPKSQM